MSIKEAHKQNNKEDDNLYYCNPTNLLCYYSPRIKEYKLYIEHKQNETE